MASNTKPKKDVPKDRTDRNIVGRTVARLRTERGLTQEQLAARCHVRHWDVSRDVIKRIERGEREVTDRELTYLAKALRAPIQALFE